MSSSLFPRFRTPELTFPAVIHFDSHLDTCESPAKASHDDSADCLLSSQGSPLSLVDRLPRSLRSTTALTVRSRRSLPSPLSLITTLQSTTLRKKD